MYRGRSSGLAGADESSWERVGSLRTLYSQSNQFIARLLPAAAGKKAHVLREAREGSEAGDTAMGALGQVRNTLCGHTLCGHMSSTLKFRDRFMSTSEQRCLAR
jgi:hypothetical protein